MERTWLILLGLVLFVAPASVQAQFEYTTNADGVSITITNYDGSGGAVTIPTNINGLTVTSIGDESFIFNPLVTSVAIPGSVKTIGNAAFYFCFNLTNVSLTSGVTNIGTQAFDACEGLSSLTIPGSVTGMGEDLVNGCRGLTNITIANGVTSVGEYAFEMCWGLTSVTIPSSVTNIGEGSFFNCTNLASAMIPSGVTTIGGIAFQYCASLTNATIPVSVTNIGLFAFYGCTDLGSVTIACALTNGPGMFWDCTSLSNVTMANTVTTIGNGWFVDCTSLVHVTIPVSVTNIESDAFYGCTNLIGAYFQGNAPNPNNNTSVFFGDNNATAYYYAGTTGWIATFDGIQTMELNPPSGSIQVFITPSSVVSAGAQWQVDGGSHEESGSKVTLVAGSHIVSFTSIPDWATPTNQMVTIKSGVTTKVTGVYLQGNPKLTIASPRSAQSVSNAALLITGSVTDNVAVDGVFYQLNGGGWTLATSSNAWSNWAASVTLIPGANTISAYAVDTRGTFSATNTVDFTYNVFLAALGTYNGLFAPANTPRQQTNSGAITFTVSTSGVLSGKLTIGTNTPSLSGQFNPAGAVTLISAGPGVSTLTTTMQLDVAGQSVQGTVGDGSFLATLAGYRQVFNSSSQATNYEGQYTLIIPGADDPAVGPFGTGYGSVTVSGYGGVTFGGALADGTSVHQSSVVSEAGYWPFYLPLYNGGGSLWGWNCFTNHAIMSATALSWINSTNSSLTAVYRSGFTNQQVAVLGSLYDLTDNPLLSLTNALVILDGGNLPFAITNQVTLEAGNTIAVPVIPENTNKLKLMITTNMGLITGSFLNPGNPKQAIMIYAILLQNQTNAQGYFLGTNQSGAFKLGPQ